MTRYPPEPQSNWAWFFDIDGTLAAIAETPDMVEVDPRMREVIAKLQVASGGAIALISGRSIANVDELFAGLRLPVAGQHGAERRGADSAMAARTMRNEHLDGIRDRLRLLQGEYPALFVEDKGMSLALHYRQAPQLEALVREQMRVIHAQHASEFKLQHGKCVVEIVPRGISKGNAVQAYMMESPFRDRTPVFVGDDVTDEDAFAAVNEMRGISIKVGDGVTEAPYRLPDVAAVQEWLTPANPSLPISRERAS